jgi:hypothetical protein
MNKSAILNSKRLTVSVVSKTYITEIKQILREARSKAYASVNYAMMYPYWLVGKRIIEEIQQGEHRANYCRRKGIRYSFLLVCLTLQDTPYRACRKLLFSNFGIL